MELPSRYEDLKDGPGIRLSYLAGFLPGVSEEPGVTEILNRLEGERRPWGEVALATTDRTAPDASWELVLTPETGRPIHLSPVHTDNLNMLHLESSHLRKIERAVLDESRWAIGLLSSLDEEPLRALHLHLRILHAAVQGSATVFDVTGCRIHGASWVDAVVRSHAMPPPDTLYSIHIVGDDEGETVGHWVHTHGLLRCGLPEVEMLDVPEAACGSCVRLLNAVVGLFMDRGLPPPDESFYAGRDLPLVWLPWEEAVGCLPKDCLGGVAGREAFHRQPAAVLFAPQRGLLRRKLVCPARYDEILQDDPALYVTALETARMADLAAEAFPRFRRLYERWAGRDQFRFCIKLGYPVDGSAAREGMREQLWFAVETLGDEGCRARLLNEPYGVAAMKEGDVEEHALDLMCDWQIFSPHGEFGPDTVVLLEGILDGILDGEEKS